MEVVKGGEYIKTGWVGFGMIWYVKMAKNANFRTDGLFYFIFFSMLSIGPN